MQKGKYTPKRLLSLLLALVMLLGMLPTGVFAAVTTTAYSVRVGYKPDFYTNTEAFTLEVAPAYGQAVYAGQTITVPCTVSLTAAETVNVKFTSFTIGGVSMNEQTLSASDASFAVNTAEDASGENITKDKTYTVTVDVPVTVGEDLSISIPVSFSGTAGGKNLGEYTSTSYGYGTVDETAIHTGNATITGMKQATCNVFFMDNGDGVYNKVFTNPTTVNRNSTLSAFPNPSRAGYVFDGWYSDVDLTTRWIFEGDTTAEATHVMDATTQLYAKWILDDGTGTREYYTVKFVKEKEQDAAASNWPDPAELKIAKSASGTALILNYDINIPSLAGYTFEGWSITPLAPSVADITGSTNDVYGPMDSLNLEELDDDGDGIVNLYAKWSENQYTITYTAPVSGSPADYNTETGATKTTSVRPGDMALFSVKVLAGYDASTMIVTANGQPLNCKSTTVKENGNAYYFYQFAPSGNTTVEISTQPSKLTYNVSLPISETSLFTAQFTDIAGTTTGDTLNAKSATVEYGQSVKFKITAADKYTVKAVYVNDELLTPTDGVYTISNIQENKAVRVEVEAVVFHTVQYITDYHGFLMEQSVQSGADVNLDEIAPTVDGYNFDGWYLDSRYTQTNKVTSLTNVTEDTILYGKYTPKSVEISYDLNENSYTGNADARKDITGVTPASITTTTTKTYGQAATLDATVPTSTNYDFLGWAKSPDGPVVYAAGATVSEEVTADTTLYAVWAIKTFNVVINAGQGYTVHWDGAASNVAYGDTVTFNLVVDSDHTQQAPKLYVDPGTEVATVDNGRPSNSDPKQKVYGVSVGPITANTSIKLLGIENETYTVTYKYAGLDAARTTSPKNGDVYLQQHVEWNDPAAQPIAPSVEGYDFLGWYIVKTGTTTDSAAASDKIVGDTAYTKFDFATPITANTDVFALFQAQTPTVTFKTVNGEGWEIKNLSYTAPDGTAKMNQAATNAGFNIKYGTDVEFELVVQSGYDWSKLALAANGYALTQNGEATVDEDGVTTVKFKLTNVTANTTITVAGIVRKTVTITYYANATDDVKGVPGMQTAKYYIANPASGVTNDNLDASVPSRVGYKFLGWAMVPAYHNGTSVVYDKSTTSGDTTTITQEVYSGTLYRPGTTSVFTSNTNLYAVWQATTLTVTLDITENFLDAAGINYSYEGDEIKLSATLKNGTETANANGTFTFYQKARGTESEPTAAGWTVAGTTSIIGGGEANITIPTPEYATNANKYWYKVVFTPLDGKGYASCESGAAKLRVYSRAISWEPKAGSNVADNALTIYASDGETKVDEMVANTVYYLELPKVREMDGGLQLKNGSSVAPALNVGEHYEVIWQYQDANNSWKDYPYSDNTNRVKIEAEYSGYSFRAKVKPTENSIYTKAAAYDADQRLCNNVYEDYLYTLETVKVVLKDTSTALTIDAPTESQDVTIYGETPFTKDHLAQYEGETVKLTAIVTKESAAGDAVNNGYVNFYRVAKTGETEDVLLNDTPIKVGANGVATFDAETTAFNKTITIDDNETAVRTVNDKYYAVYLENVTYKTSTSETGTVYIKSTQFQIPIVESANPGVWLDDDGVKHPTSDPANDKPLTTYTYNLAELVSGIAHTFTLRTVYDSATMTDAKYSVVALDGRAVEQWQYTIDWYTVTGDNPVKALGDNQNTAYTTSDNKDGDCFFVRLTATESGNMTGTADSKLLMIGKKQDVTVKVEADDAILATEVDLRSNKYPDVYQLNPITLRAWVDPTDTNATKLPKEGNGVHFFYIDGDKTVSLGEVALKKDAVNNRMYAELETSELPVNANGTYRNVVITAVYYGDESFNQSENWVYDAETGKYSCLTTELGSIETATVTVYSSVVFNCADENKPTAGNDDFGIHISLKDGAAAAHENSVLELSDIYTLDRGLDETLRNAVAKLKLDGSDGDADVTIQWQRLKDTNYEDTDFSKASRWENISGANGTTLVLTGMPQDTAYRAVITVKNTARVQGSYQQLTQDEANADNIINGRQVYYSNILTTGEADTTISVNLNTSKVGETNSEGVTEGETVTANVFVSGASNATPNVNVTVTITNDAAKGNTTAYEKTIADKNTVNGWAEFAWNTAESDDKGVETAPGYYTMTITSTSNTGYAIKTITRSIIVRESTYTIEAGNLTPTYNGRTQGVTVTLKDFNFNGTGVNAAANLSWTVKYYDKDKNLVEPVQAGTYEAVITLPASEYWTKQTATVEFTIQQRTVSIEDVVAQAKVYDGSKKANLVEVILNDAETYQDTTGLPKNGLGVLNGDSIYATAVGTLGSAKAGVQTLTVNGLTLAGDDAHNYKWDNNAYTEDLNVSRSQVYGTASSDLKLKQGETFPADKVIKMIDQSGRVIELGDGEDDYTLTFYYHSDTQIKQTKTINKLGLYTVIARPNQSNYKGGVELQFEVVTDETSYSTPAEPQASTLITISDTVDRYDAIDGVKATATNGATISKIEYWNGAAWNEAKLENAGRYLVKVTASTNDVAYGIYTIVKVNPNLVLTTEENLVYNSMPQEGIHESICNGTPISSAPYFVTWAGDVAIGGNVPMEGNVDEQAPVNAGTYTVTLHVNETTNYTAHELSRSFTIDKAPLTITADSWQTMQYGAMPEFTASYDGFAATSTDDTPDVWTRDVQIDPELVVNGTDGFSNDMLDQVGNVSVEAVDALSKNYAITYVKGTFSKQRTDAQPTLAIHGVQNNSTNDLTTVYYGDEIQLYPYGSYVGFNNGSSILTWSIASGSENAEITSDGLLTVKGVGDFTVKLTRGTGESAISVTRTFTSLKKEVQVAVPDQDKVYSGIEQSYTGTPATYDLNWFAVTAGTTLSNDKRTNIGTQIVNAVVPASETTYQSRIYGGKFTINDKDAKVAPTTESHIYGSRAGTLSATVTGKVGTVEPVTGIKAASQTDTYNRLDVFDGYEILVAGTEDINYNVKYVTDQKAEDSQVTAYNNVKLYSTTTKAEAELNDATVYGDAANVLDWILQDAITGDTLADFNIADDNGVFIAQDYDNCDGNSVTYKAANREEGNTSGTALAADRTAKDPAEDDNYELNFMRVVNTKAANYRLTDSEKKNNVSTMTPPTGTVGFIGAGATADNLIEGSANIAQRPVTLTVATGVKLYWHMPQDQMYNALLSVISASNLAPGHTIADLDLTLKLTVDGTVYTIDPTSGSALHITNMTNATATVTAVVGDTNYKLMNSSGNIGDITLKTIQIEATYTTKTFTNFTVLIKAHADNGTISALTSADGLTYKIFKKTGDTVGTTVYAEGSLTYMGYQMSDGKHLCGVFTASYSPALPTLGANETYYIQMYEYGVPLVTSK